MFSRKWTFGISLLSVVCCLLGLYRLQDAEPEEQSPIPAVEISTPQRLAKASEPLFSEDINSDFYQTIICNNLFAPLGTVLNQKPAPGANLQLIATFTTDDPRRSTAIVKNTATGAEKTVRIGDKISDYSVLDIQAKQILIEKEGAPAVWKRMTHPFLLNAKRR